MSQSRSSFSARFLAPLLAAGLAIPGAAQDAAPPGLKLIKGGSTKIGLEVKEIEKLMKDDEAMRNYAGALCAATPQHTVDVPDFYLMVTEVTNEMYAAYVQATGAKPPEHWGAKAIDEARAIFLKEQGRIREEAKKQGLDVPERTTFDTTEWWRKNWKTAQWAIPEGSEYRPVVFVSYAEAQSYARWAGLRLMTEFEFERAVRGDTERNFPWGDEWDDQKYAATNALRGLKQAFPAGSFPDGASADGIYDLAGNVWEWTSSPYVAFPKWKRLSFSFGKGKGKEKVEALADWNADNRVAVGGCYHNDPLAAWATTRRNTERSQATNALGFRCAGSKRAGVDMAETVYREDLPPEVRPQGANGPVTYSFERTDAIDMWVAKDSDTRAGIATSDAKAEPAQATTAQIPPPGYAVIERYDYALFTPVEQIYSAQKGDLEEESVEKGPVHIGFLSTNQPFLLPELEPGTYMVAYRGAGEAKKKRRARKADDEGETKEGEGAEAEEQEEETAPDDPLTVLKEKLGLDTDIENLILYDRTGQPVAVLPLLAGLDYKTVEEGAITSFDKKIKLPPDPDDPKAEPIEKIEKWSRFHICIPGRSPRKGFFFDIDVRFEEAFYAKSWRKK